MPVLTPLSQLVTQRKVLSVSGTILALWDTAYLLKFGKKSEKKETTSRLENIGRDIDAMRKEEDIIRESIKQYSLDIDLDYLQFCLNHIKKQDYDSSLINDLMRLHTKFIHQYLYHKPSFVTKEGSIIYKKISIKTELPWK